MRAINVMATDNIQNTRSRSLRELLRLDHFNKEEVIYVDRIINKYSDMCWLPDEPLNHTDVTAHKIVTIDDRPINTKQYRFSSFKDEINKQDERFNDE